MLSAPAVAAQAQSTLSTASLNTTNLATPAPALDSAWARDQELGLLHGQTTAQLNSQTAFTADTGRDFGPAVEFREPTQNAFGASLTSTGVAGFAATSNQDIWVEGDGFSDRLRVTTRGTLRRADGTPVPPGLQDVAGFDVEGYDLRYTRGWPVARGYTPSGLEVTLTPHAGIGVGDRGGSAEAGATLRIGQGLDRMVREGTEAFGERARWYLYAAGSGRAVGYNFARTRDGDYARSGYTHDSGSFLGDASIGVAYRKGAMQGSFGVVYRQIEAEGLPRNANVDKDVSEGLIAFQLSLKPEW